MVAVLSKPTKPTSKQTTQPTPLNQPLENIQQNRVWVPPIEPEMPPNERERSPEYLSSLIALFLLLHSRFKFNYFTQILTAIIFLFGHFNILLF
jgi:hypothetical protein